MMKVRILGLLAGLMVSISYAGGPDRLATFLPPPEKTDVNPLYNSAFAPKKPLAKYVLFDESAPHVAVYLTGGAFASYLNDNQQIVVDQYGTVNTYSPSAKWNTLFGMGVGMGRILYPYPFEHFKVSVLPAFYYANFGTVNGTLYPDTSGGSFDTLNYQLKASSYALMAETHLSYTQYSWRPVAVLGVGAALNHLYDYSEVPTNSSGSASPTNFPFSTKNSAAFAFEVGAGLSHPVYVNAAKTFLMELSLEYRYFNFGTGSLGSSIGGDSYQIDPISAQAVLLSLGMDFA